jgi:TonB family protein
MKIFLLPFACVLLFAATGLVQQTNAQSCVLQVSASESIREKDPANEGSVPARKSPLKKFTATAMDLASRRIYKGTPSADYVRFENIPEGMYRLTVRSASFKTSEETHSFDCAYADNGIDFVDVLMERGRPSQIVSRKSIIVTTTRDTGRLTVAPDGEYRAQAPASTDPKRVPKIISGGVLNGRATVLPQPPYPPIARSQHASGSVVVQVLIDETGKVISASAVSGHPLLEPAAVAAARKALFSPTLLGGVPVKVSGIISYNFVP